MKPSRHTPKPGSSEGRVAAANSRLGGIPPVRIDYDEGRTSEERGTYHQPRLAAQAEFFLDVHPVSRLKSVFTGGKPKR